MRVFACYVVSKLQRHRCPTFGALRPRTQRTNGQLHFYIYRYYFIILDTVLVNQRVSQTFQML
jgi:hypothetical protein